MTLVAWKAAQLIAPAAATTDPPFHLERDMLHTQRPVTLSMTSA